MAHGVVRGMTCRYCTDLAVEVSHDVSGCVPCCGRHYGWRVSKLDGVGHGLYCPDRERRRAAPIATSAFGATLAK